MKVLAVFCDDVKVNSAGPGENVKVKLAGINDEDISPGFVLSSPGNQFLCTAPLSSECDVLAQFFRKCFFANGSSFYRKIWAGSFKRMALLGDNY